AARHEDHRLGEHFEGAAAIGPSERGDAMDWLILKFAASGSVDDAEQEAKIFGLLKALQDAWHGAERLRGIQCVVLNGDSGKIRIDAEAFDQHIGRNVVERDLSELQIRVRI